MVVGHEHHVEQLLALRVDLPQPCVDSLQRLATPSNTASGTHTSENGSVGRMQEDGCRRTKTWRGLVFMAFMTHGCVSVFSWLAASFKTVTGVAFKATFILLLSCPRPPPTETNQVFIIELNAATSWRAAGFVLLPPPPPPPHWQNSDLNEGEGRPRAEGLRFVLHLVPDVLLHALLLVDLLLLLHVEEDPRRHRDGDGVLRLRLERQEPTGERWSNRPADGR